jgi:PAS domain S-box-containing protein
MSDAADHGFRDIVEAVPIGIVVHRERRIVYASRVCLDAMGLERLDELLGRDPVDVLAPGEREKHAQHRGDGSRGGERPRRRGSSARMGGRTPSRSWAIAGAVVARATSAPASRRLTQFLQGCRAEFKGNCPRPHVHPILCHAERTFVADARLPVGYSRQRGASTCGMC